MLTLPFFLSLCSIFSTPISSQATSTGSVVKVDHSAGEFRLTFNGKPYFVKGAGGGADPAYLASAGGNSIRTWGADGIGKVLDDAQNKG